jgi:hypothetical protein
VAIKNCQHATRVLFQVRKLNKCNKYSIKVGVSLADGRECSNIAVFKKESLRAVLLSLEVELLV